MITNLGKLIVLLGSVMVLLGGIMLLFGKLLFFGRLPGDVYIQKKNFSFYTLSFLNLNQPYSFLAFYFV